jgi:uncharacterized membrane protein YhhN
MSYFAACKAVISKQSKEAKRANTLRLIGALLFPISDFVLAFNKFIFPLPFAKLIVMITYYASQFFITYSA